MFFTTNIFNKNNFQKNISIKKINKIVFVPLNGHFYLNKNYKKIEKKRTQLLCTQVFDRRGTQAWAWSPLLDYYKINIY